MLHTLPDEVLAKCLAILPHVELLDVQRVCKSWVKLRRSKEFRVARAAVDEHALVVTNWTDAGDCTNLGTYALVGGSWRMRTASGPGFRRYPTSTASVTGESFTIPQQIGTRCWDRCPCPDFGVILEFERRNLSIWNTPTSSRAAPCPPCRPWPTAGRPPTRGCTRRWRTAPRWRRGATRPAR